MRSRDRSNEGAPGPPYQAFQEHVIVFKTLGDYIVENIDDFIIKFRGFIRLLVTGFSNVGTLLATYKIHY